MKKNHSLERIKEERKKSRADRISSLIKKTIAEILIQIDFSDSLGNNILIFVSNVILSSDGKNATVFLETINYTGGIDKDILETINEKTSKIKKEFSSRIDLRYTPKLKFKVTSTHNWTGIMKKNQYNGWIYLDKPLGITSNFALQKIKKIFKNSKAGFVGTLDPMATGFLPIALGSATKVIPYIEKANKEYLFTIKWGVQSETGDAERKIIKNKKKYPSVDSIRMVLSNFVGKTLFII